MNALTLQKTAAERRREMLAIPQVVSALEPHEKSVFIASTKQPISEIEPKDLALELGKVLRFIFKDTGYRFPGDDEFGYIVLRVREILKRYYGFLTMADFKLAFEMCITGELDEYLPKGRDGQADRGHYQQFNAEYVCKILNAYKSRRASVLRRAYDAIPEAEPERDIKREEDLHNRTKRGCLKAFDFFKENGYLPELSPIAEMLYYDLLSSAGLAPEIEVTLEEQKAIFNRTMNQYSRRGMVGDMKRLRAEGIDASELRYGSFSLARKRALKDAFAKMAAENVVLTNYIKIDGTEDYN